jgi:hypothetical protein
MTRRNATTLVEVLVAIFVMAIGLLTLLTLFPLGALSMSQAIKDDRTAHAASNAAAMAEALNIRNGLYGFWKLGRSSDSGSGPALDPDPFTNPGEPGNPLPNLNTVTNYDGPSYPVYVDPFGYWLYSRWIAKEMQPVPLNFRGIPRRNMSSPSHPINNPPILPLGGPGMTGEKYRWFGLMDDMTFQSDGSNQGLPVTNSGQVEREGRYTWAYLLRRPRYFEPKVVDLTVVVYSGRSDQLPLNEYAYGKVLFDPASNFVTFDYGANKPPIRKGSWIMDATMLLPSGRPQPRGFFYRVVGVTEPAAGRMTLELQTNPRGDTTGTSDTPFGFLVFLENVVEVFEKGAGWRP